MRFDKDDNRPIYVVVLTSVVDVSCDVRRA